VAVLDELGSGLLAFGGVEEADGADLDGLLAYFLLDAGVERISCLAVRSNNDQYERRVERRSCCLTL